MSEGAMSTEELTKAVKALQEKVKDLEGKTGQLEEHGNMIRSKLDLANRNMLKL